jgi:hypothetical protein
MNAKWYAMVQVILLICEILFLRIDLESDVYSSALIREQLESSMSGSMVAVFVLFCCSYKRFAIASIYLQLVLLTKPFWDVILSGGDIVPVDLSLDILVQAVHITIAAVIGLKTIPDEIQTAKILIALAPAVILASLNAAIGDQTLSTIDHPGSIRIFIFSGSLYVVLGYMLRSQKPLSEGIVLPSWAPLLIFALWPLFNAALFSGVDQLRSILSTLLALISSVGFGSLFSSELDSCVLLISAGVSLGSCSGMSLDVWCSVLIGMLSVFIALFCERRRYGLLSGLILLSGIFGGIVSGVFLLLGPRRKALTQLLAIPVAVILGSLGGAIAGILLRRKQAHQDKVELV